MYSRRMCVWKGITISKLSIRDCIGNLYEIRELSNINTEYMCIYTDLIRALDKCKYKQEIILHIVRGYTAREIAKIYKVDHTTITRRVNIGLKQIEEELQW